MKKVALIVGHNPRSRGAYSPFLRKSEYEYYREVVDIINKIDDTIDIYTREANENYIAEMKPVVAEINKYNYDYILELHFNSAIDRNTRGCLCLAHKNSFKGKNIAKTFNEKINKIFGIPIKNGGLIEITDSSQRGAFGICKTFAPYVLIEPFFGSNEEARKFKNPETMANFILSFIREE